MCANFRNPAMLVALEPSFKPKLSPRDIVDQYL